MSAEQEWSGCAQIDSWPTSSQSPGISPQPSPDSQLLEPPLPLPANTEVNTNTANLIEKKLLPNHHIQQAVSHNYQQSPFISQSNQPVLKDNPSQQLSIEKRATSIIGSQPHCKAENLQSFNNNCFVGTPNVTQPRPRPISSQSSPQKLQIKNFNRPPTVGHTAPQTSQFNHPVRPSRPLPPQQGSKQVRPQTSQFIANQMIKNPQANFQPIRSKHSIQNPQQQQQQQGIQQQFAQHHHPQNTIRQQNVQSVQNQNPTLKPVHSQPSQIRPNLQVSNQAPNQHFPPSRSMPQTHPNTPTFPRLQSPTGGQRPRMVSSPVRPQGPNVGRGISPQPNPNSFVRPPHFSNANQQGNVRFGNVNVRPRGPGIQHGMQEEEIDPYDDDDFDEFDEENEDMFYDEEEDEDYEEANEEMFNQQQHQNFPPGFDDQHSDGSEGSDEEQLLLEELVLCNDHKRYEMIHQQLTEKGVTEEEIEEFKENYARHNYEEEMDYYDEEMDDDDEDDEEEEEMVSSSSMILPRNTNPIQQQQQPTSQNRLPPTSSQPGNQTMHQEQTGTHQPPLFTSSAMHQTNPRPEGSSLSSAPNRPHPVGHSTPLPVPQRKMAGPISKQAVNPHNESVQQPTQAVPLHLHQLQQPKIQSTAPASTLGAPTPRPQGSVQTSPTTQLNTSPRIPTGPQLDTRMPTPVNSSSSQFIQSTTPNSVNPPSHTVHHSHSSSAPHSGNTSIPSGNIGPQLGNVGPSSGNLVPQSVSAGYQPVQVATVIPTVRAPVRHTGHVQSPPRFPHIQTQPLYARAMHNRMPVPQGQLRASLGASQPPSDAQLARQAVLQMQQRLDAEIMAKKRPQLNMPISTFPSQPSAMGGSHMPRPAPLTGTAHIIRPKLPPRTPIPQMPRSRHVSPGTNFNDQQHTRFQGPGSGPIRPRPPQAPQTGVAPGQSTGSNRLTPSLTTTHPAVTSNNPITSQQTLVSTAGVKMPRPTVPSQTTGLMNQLQQLNQQHQQMNQQQPQMQQQQPQQQINQQLPQQQQQSQQMNQKQQQQQLPQQQQTQQMNQQGPHQQLQQNSSKVDAFNLGGLSEDKCILKGSQQLVTNKLYQIRSPIDQSLVLARWNGERFEDLNAREQKQLQQSGMMSSSSPAPPANDQPVVATSNSGTPVQPLPPVQQQTTRIPTTTKPPPVKTSEESITTQSTYVKPLPNVSTETLLEDKKPVEPEKENDDDAIFKKPLNNNEDYYRVCKHCGYTSENFKRCEGCRRIFQGEVKIHSKKKFTSPTSESAPSPAAGLAIDSNTQSKSITKLDGWTRDEKREEQSIIRLEPKRFYGSSTRGRGRGGRRPARGIAGRTRGGGMLGRMGYGPGDDDYDSSDSEDPLDIKHFNDGGMEEQAGKRKAPKGRGKGPGGRKRSKKVDEPVTVMISSDEDEPSSTSNSFYGIPPPQSPASSAGSSPIFPSMSSEPSGAFGRFRRVKMEDEDGNSKLRKKMEQQAMMPMGMDDDEDEDDEEGDEPPTYQIEIRSVRIGSMRTKPEGPLFINMRGVCFRVKSERTDEPFECEIMSSEVTHVKYYGGQGQPLLFMLLTQESGEKLRVVFHMEEGGDEYLDPSSTDMKQKMVVIIIESLDYLPQDMRETLSLWADINNVSDAEFIEELTEESANDLLIHTAPPVLTADVEHHMVNFKKGYMKTERSSMLMPRAPNSPQSAADNEPDSTSSSPPQQTDQMRYFEGPPIRLLQYPPPPARGIPITTGDLFCLNEGEFLNDVIIDFYLQYLHEEMLSEELRSRTHIFSSFFYKRLTQKDRHSEKTEEDAKKSLPERRHARVRKWTKTVDLFSKDYIIVPINEHSHWYLAVICFPGLATPEVVPFIPSTSHTDEVDDSNNPEGSQEDGGTPEEGTSSQPERTAKQTVFGRQLDPENCQKNEENNYSLGQKQPCILIFDSLLGPTRNPNVKMLRDYLQCEWNAKKSEPRMISKILRGSTPKVPQQSNYSDCGVYLLQFVESFFEDPIADFQIPMKGLQHWFTEDLIVNKREDIHNLIMKLHRRFQEDRGDPNILDIKYESGPPSPPWDPHPPLNHPPPSPHSHQPILPQDDSTDGQEMTNSNCQDGENHVNSLGDNAQSKQLENADEQPNSPVFKSCVNNTAFSNKGDSTPMKTDDDKIKSCSLLHESSMREADNQKDINNSAVNDMGVDNNQDNSNLCDINNSMSFHSQEDEFSKLPHNGMQSVGNELSIETVSNMKSVESQNINSVNNEDNNDISCQNNMEEGNDNS